MRIHSKAYRYLGFSLLELVIVLAIMAVVSSVGLTLYQKSQINSNYNIDKKLLEEIKQSLLIFVMVNKYLPCPDINQDGFEDREADFSCSSTGGYLPYLDLGVETINSWGKSFGYAVNTGVTKAKNIVDSASSASYFNQNNITTPAFTLETPPTGAYNGRGNLKICKASAAKCNSGSKSHDLYANLALSLVIDFGKNGCVAKQFYQEKQNCAIFKTKNQNFYLSEKRDGKVFFDDNVVWINAYEFKSYVLRGGVSFN